MYDRYGSAFESAGGGAGPRWQTFRGGPKDSRTSTWASSSVRAVRAAASKRSCSNSPAAAGKGDGPALESAAPNLEHELHIRSTPRFRVDKLSCRSGEPGGKSKPITVTIPAGIKDGEKMRLRGQGEPAPSGGAPGESDDHHSRRAHPYFRRRGNDLELSCP